MSSAADFRVSISFFDHPKTMRLEAASGEKAVLALLRLWAWASRHRSNGELTGLTNREIATAARWKGKADLLVAALESTGWLDRDGASIHLHDWADWQGWVCGSGSRSHAGRVAAMTRRCLLTGMDPDAYLDAQGGQAATDNDLRIALRAAHRKATEKRAPAVRTALRPHCEGGASRSAPIPTPTPTPTPSGERVGTEAASRPPSEASGAAPPGGGRRIPVEVCSDCRQRPRAPGRGLCEGCLTPARPRDPTPAASEAPARGYSLPPSVQPCPRPPAPRLTRRKPRRFLP